MADGDTSTVTQTTVLVVEDDSLTRQCLCRWLESDGYRTLAAEDADQALAMATADRPAVAICDVELKTPSRNGGWLSGQLLKQHASMTVVFATANHQLPVELTMRPGVSGYVIKPYSKHHILAAVGDARLLAHVRQTEAARCERLAAEAERLRADLHGRIGATPMAGQEEWPTLLKALDPAADIGAQTRLASLAHAVAGDIGVSGAALRSVPAAMALRRLGLQAVPSELLTAPRRLARVEREFVHRYPSQGREALLLLGFIDAAEMVGAMRERWDGLGYPGKLAAAEIPAGAAVLAVVDSFAAMQSSRSYRAALEMDAAAERLCLRSGTYFSPRVVEAFLMRLREADRAAAP